MTLTVVTDPAKPNYMHVDAFDAAGRYIGMVHIMIMPDTNALRVSIPRGQRIDGQRIEGSSDYYTINIEVR